MYSVWGVDPPTLTASHRWPEHAAVSSPRQTRHRSSERLKLTWPLTPWRLHLEETSAPLCLSYSKSVFTITQLGVSNTHTHPCTQNYTRNPLCSLTDRNYRLFDFTDSISNLWQLTDSPLRAAYWQGTHALFTNQQGPPQHGCKLYNFEVCWNEFRH